MSDCIFNIEDGSLEPINFQLPAIKVENLEELRWRLMHEFDFSFMESTASAVGVKNEAEACHALSMALEVRRIRKELDDCRTRLVKPHFDSQKNINQVITDFKEKLKSIEDGLQEKITAWIDSQNDNPFTAVERLDVEGGCISVQKCYDFIITDESLIPDEFKSINTSAIGKTIRYGIRNIPGVEIFEKKQTILRSKNRSDR